MIVRGCGDENVICRSEVVCKGPALGFGLLPAIRSVDEVGLSVLLILLLCESSSESASSSLKSSFDARTFGSETGDMVDCKVARKVSILAFIGEGISTVME